MSTLDKDTLRVDKVRLRYSPDVGWQLESAPDEVYELWFLRTGRQDGERIGWLGRRRTAWEYRMAPGVTPSGGFATTEHDAVGEMLAALECA